MLKEALNPVEVSGIAAAARISQERSYSKQWALMKSHLEQLVEAGRFSVTHIAMEESPSLRLLAQEVIGGSYRDAGRVRIAEDRLAFAPIVELATVDGRPFASKDKSKGAHIRGVSMGTKAVDVKALRQLRKQGKDPETLGQFGPRFSLPANQALDLLMRYGYRVRDLRARRRFTANPIDLWVLYEVGGPLEAEVHELYADELRAAGLLPPSSSRPSPRRPAGAGG